MWSFLPLSANPWKVCGSKKRVSSETEAFLAEKPQDQKNNIKKNNLSIEMYWKHLWIKNIEA